MVNSTDVPISSLPHNWRLIPIPSGRKGPVSEGWNKLESCHAPGKFWTGYSENVGLCHAYSGTAAIDIDDLEATRAYLLGECGESIDDLLADPRYPQISSGRDNRAKILFRLDDPLPTFKIGESTHTFFELRCATRDGLTVQDVIPPSIHPDTGQPYRWINPEALQSLPEMPPWLKTFWQRQLVEDNNTTPAPSVPIESIREQYPDEKLQDMLTSLDPDMGREDWLHTGMAVHWLDPSLYWIWDGWSSTGAKYVGPHDTERVWRSFDETNTGRHITIRTLEQMARRAGWHEKLQMGPIDTPPVENLPSPLAQPVLESPGDHVFDDLVSRIGTLSEVSVNTTPGQQVLLEIVRGALALDRVQQEIVLSNLRRTLPRGQAQIVNTLVEQVRSEEQTIAREEHTRTLGPEVTRYLTEWVYVMDQDKMYHPKTGQLIATEAYRNATARYTDPEGITVWDLFIEQGHGTTVSAIGFDPGQPPIFERNGTTYVNRWQGVDEPVYEGDITPWSSLLEQVIPEESERDHFVKYLAHTIQFPGRKINHALLLAGAEGCGKDSLIQPVRLYLGDVGTGGYSVTVHGSTLTEPYNGYLLGAKLVIYNETAHGEKRGISTRSKGQEVAERLKEIAAAPPDWLHINGKYQRQIRIQNLCSTVIFSNDRHPLTATDSRRFFAIWSPLETRSTLTGLPLPGWDTFWPAYWDWINAGGWRAVVHHLLQVDLTGFDAGAAPGKTRFWRDIEHESRSPLEELIVDNLAENPSDLWTGDILTAQWIRADLARTGCYKTYGLRDVPTIRSIANALTHVLRMSGKRVDGPLIQGKPRKKSPTYWIHCNVNKYAGLNGREMYDLLTRRDKELFSNQSADVTWL